MNYEKAYKEALERAREFQKSKDGLCVLTAESIFPELKESEDEKIRKEIISVFTGESSFTPKEEAQKYVAWLEKQGEQKAIINIPSREVILAIWDLGNEWKELTNGSISTKYGTQLDYIQKHWHESEYYLREKQGEPADKIEPKFKVGDWIVQENIGVYKIIEVCESWYEVISYINGKQFSIAFDYEYMCHLWTIQDAKDGDVLATDGMIFIFKIIHGIWLSCYCSIHQDGSINESPYDLMTNKYFNEVHPATKEQRELLFKKMKESRYEWNPDTKELKKV